MRARRSIMPAVLAAGVLLLGGCDQMARSWYLSGCDREIRNATRAIDSAGDDARRAAAYSQRGRAFSEKARYSRFFKLIGADEFSRLFALAAQDHDRAVQLDPASAELYFSRGQSYYDRATVEERDSSKPWYERAAADFQRAVDRDSRHAAALDMLGLAHESSGDLDNAITAYAKEMALDPLGRRRLADAYCNRGSSNQQAKKNDAAIADYEKAVELGTTDDGCSCEPYSPLLALYVDGGQYQKARDAVQKAQKSRKWLDPELLERLKKANGQG